MRILRAIGQFFVRVWRWIRWVTMKPSKRQFRVIRCPEMPSLIGMKCYGTPRVNQPIIFVKNKDEGHRVVTPAHILKRERGNREIYTKYLYFFVKRIK